jgi:hypothetical protein
MACQVLFRAISASINGKLKPLTEQLNTLIISTGMDLSDLMGEKQQEAAQLANATSPKASGKAKRWGKDERKQNKAKGKLGAFPRMSAPRHVDAGMD